MVVVRGIVVVVVGVLIDLEKSVLFNVEGLLMESRWMVRKLAQETAKARSQLAVAISDKETTMPLDAIEDNTSISSFNHQR
jgi:hypothetical protein